MKFRIAMAVMTMTCSFVLHAEDARPPKLEPIAEPRDASAAHAEGDVTVRKEGGNRIEEFRRKGRLYMVRVYPVVGLPYTMLDEKGDGVFSRQDVHAKELKPAQWSILSW